MDLLVSNASPGLRASDDFLVVGAYPPAGTFDVCTTLEDRKKALVTIPKVARRARTRSTARRDRLCGSGASRGSGKLRRECARPLTLARMDEDDNSKRIRGCRLAPGTRTNERAPRRQPIPREKPPCAHPTTFSR
jgi:hypothetical protein